MTKNASPKSKDSADKRTFNPHGGREDQHSEVEQPDTLGRQPGQYTGRGVPSLQKK